ncbi:MAG: polysaccharide biosynthesis/export family protein [Dysgonomonas sp.]
MKYILHYLLCGIAIISLFSSCISQEETNYLQAINTSYAKQAYKEYRLLPGDLISCGLTTSDKEFLATFTGILSARTSDTKTYTIYDDGTITLPLFGSIQVAGKTVQEAEDAIQNKMQESIKDAQARVTLASNTFYILSNNKQGKYAVYKDNMTIYQALAISGQTTETMDLKNVSIIRKDEQGNTIVKNFDLRTQDVIQSEFYYIQPNDVIYFPTNKNAFFNITSLNSFITTITVPLVFLIYVSTAKF